MTTLYSVISRLVTFKNTPKGKTTSVGGTLVYVDTTAGYYHFVSNEGVPLKDGVNAEDIQGLIDKLSYLTPEEWSILSALSIRAN